MGGKCCQEKQGGSPPYWSPRYITNLLVIKIDHNLIGLITAFPSNICEMFQPIQDLLPLVCWSQGSGYSLRVSKGSLYGVSPDQIPRKCWGWSTLMCSQVFPILKKRDAKIESQYRIYSSLLYCTILQFQMTCIY